MTKRLQDWARLERQGIREEIDYLKAGGRVISPSGDDITKMKLDQLHVRFEGVNRALQEIDNAPRP
jgi:hypothetical protein